MNTVLIIEMIAVSVLRLLNVQCLESIIFKKSPAPKPSALFISNAVIYLASALLFILSELYSGSIKMRIISFISYYLFYILSLISLENKVPKRNTIYTCFAYLIIDSLIQSSLYLFVEPIFANADKNLIMRTISVVTGAAVLAVLKIMIRKYSTSLMIFDYTVIPEGIYLLIILALGVLSFLLENQLIEVDPSDIPLQSHITKILTAVIVPCLVILIISLLITTSYKGYYENSSHLLKKQIDSQLEHYKEQYNKSEQIKAFRHDFKNHMLSIKGLLDKGCYPEAIAYINNISDRFGKISKEYSTGNKIADAMLSEKNSQAESHNISINFEGEIFSDIDYADICTILSNALDNALEACSKVEDRQRTINISCGFRKNIQIIKISNPTSESIEIVNGTVATTKQDKSIHGFGLYNIKKAIDKYGGDFSIKAENNTFILEVGFQVSGD